MEVGNPRTDKSGQTQQEPRDRKQTLRLPPVAKVALGGFVFLNNLGVVEAGSLRGASGAQTPKWMQEPKGQGGVTEEGHVPTEESTERSLQEKASEDCYEPDGTYKEQQRFVVMQDCLDKVREFGQKLISNQNETNWNIADTLKQTCPDRKCEEMVDDGEVDEALDAIKKDQTLETLKAGCGEDRDSCKNKVGDAATVNGARDALIEDQTRETLEAGCGGKAECESMVSGAEKVQGARDALIEYQTRETLEAGCGGKAECESMVSGAEKVQGARDALIEYQTRETLEAGCGGKAECESMVSGAEKVQDVLNALIEYQTRETLEAGCGGKAECESMVSGAEKVQDALKALIVERLKELLVKELTEEMLNDLANKVGNVRTEQDAKQVLEELSKRLKVSEKNIADWINLDGLSDGSGIGIAHFARIAVQAVTGTNNIYGEVSMVAGYAVLGVTSSKKISEESKEGYDDKLLYLLLVLRGIDIVRAAADQLAKREQEPVGEESTESGECKERFEGVPMSYMTQTGLIHAAATGMDVVKLLRPQSQKGIAIEFLVGMVLGKGEEHIARSTDHLRALLNVDGLMAWAKAWQTMNGGVYPVAEETVAKNKGDQVISDAELQTLKEVKVNMPDTTLRAKLSEVIKGLEDIKATPICIHMQEIMKKTLTGKSTEIVSKAVDNFREFLSALGGNAQTAVGVKEDANNTMTQLLAQLTENNTRLAYQQQQNTERFCAMQEQQMAINRQNSEMLGQHSAKIGDLQSGGAANRGSLMSRLLTSAMPQAPTGRGQGVGGGEASTGSGAGLARHDFRTGIAEISRRGGDWPGAGQPGQEATIMGRREDVDRGRAEGYHQSAAASGQYYFDGNYCMTPPGSDDGRAPSGIFSESGYSEGHAHLTREPKAS